MFGSWGTQRGLSHERHLMAFLAACKMHLNCISFPKHHLHAKSASHVQWAAPFPVCALYLVVCHKAALARTVRCVAVLYIMGWAAYHGHHCAQG